MRISEMKEALTGLAAVNFTLPDGTSLPPHFHVTEVGLVTKHFIDCGGVERRETVANFQLWEAGDYDHRLAPQKFLHILSLSEKILGREDLDIEVEYQQGTGRVRRAELPAGAAPAASGGLHAGRWVLLSLVSTPVASAAIGFCSGSII
jgi:Family of unknown function (DUF6428)